MESQCVTDRYRKYLYLSLLFDFSLLLICATFYIQSDYPSYGLNYFWMATEVVFLTVCISLFRREKGLYDYCINTYQRNARSIGNITLCVIGIVLIGTRFFLTPETVYYVQNAIYVLSILYLICGLVCIRFYRPRQESE